MIKKKKKKQKLLHVSKRLTHTERDELKRVNTVIDYTRSELKKLSAGLLALTDTIAPFYDDDDTPF